MAELSFVIENGVGVITLDRPETLNVFSNPMIEELGALPAL